VNQGSGDADFSVGDRILTIEVDGNLYGTLFAAARKKDINGAAVLEGVFIPAENENNQKRMLVTSWAAGTALGTIANGNVSLAAGQHTLSLILDPDNVIAEEDEGNNTYNRTVDIVATNEAPQAVITSPVNGNEYETNEEITFAGTFTDTDGTVEAYEWKTYKEQILLETITTEGFTRTFTETGDYQVTVKCRDDDGSWSVLADADFTIIPDNYPPTAEITRPSTDTTVLEGASITFTGTFADQDGTIAAYSWEILDDQQNQAGAGNAVNFQFQFNVIGNFLVRVRCQDNEGLWSEWDSVQVVVNEKPNEPPTAEIIQPSNDTTVVKNEAVFFDSQCSDSDGTVTAYEWKVLLNSELKQTGDEKDFTYSFPEAGTYLVIFKCQDNEGAWSEEDSLTVTVDDQPNQPPTAEILTPGQDTTVFTGTRLKFTGLCQDSDGSIEAYDWRIYKNNELVSLHGQKIYFYTFDEEGVFHVIHKCKDDDNSWSEPDTVIITAVEEGNEIPVSQITNPAADTTILTGEKIDFNGICSDSDGDIQSYLWEIYQGNELVTESSSLNFYYTFQDEGDFIVCFSCQDDDGAWSVKDSLTVTCREPNTPPNAVITNPSKDSVVIVNSEIYFTGSGTDEDGEVVSYLWEIYKNNNKLKEDSNREFSVVFNGIGDYHIYFSCQDDDGAWSGKDSLKITVEETPNIPPTARIISSQEDTTVWLGHIIGFSGVFQDDDGTIDLIEWKLRKDGEIIEQWSEESCSYRFTEAGDYLLTARCRDNDESWSESDSLFIHVIKDMIPPNSPFGIIITYNNGVFTIIWNHSGSPDWFSYNIYRNRQQNALSKKTDGELIASGVKDTIYIDTLEAENSSVSYGISTVDYSGNESEVAWSDVVTNVIDRELFNADYDFSFYPNPVRDYFHITLTDKWDLNSSRIYVFNVTGSLEFQISHLSREMDIDCANLKTGMYFIMIKEENHKKIKKILFIK